MYYTSQLNYDQTFGHRFFQSAIDLGCLADDARRPHPGVIPDLKEAGRLYRAAIADAQAGIAEVEQDEDWAAECRSVLLEMRSRIDTWTEQAAKSKQIAEVPS